MKRRSCGTRRSIFICWAPVEVDGFLSPMLPPFFPRRRFKSAISPLVEPSMLNLPIRVSRITSLADMAQIIASQ